MSARVSTEQDADQLLNRITLQAGGAAGFSSASIRSQDPVIIEVWFADEVDANGWASTYQLNSPPPRVLLDPSDETVVLLEWPRAKR